VASNAGLRKAARSSRLAYPIYFPTPGLATDNAAMIAWAGIERLRAGHTDNLDFAPRPRWPLDPNAPPVAYAGVKA